MIFIYKHNKMAGILDFYGYDSGANDIVSQKQQLLDNQAKIDGVQNEKIEELESRPCSGTVISVNGQTGNVILDADDVGAATSEQGMKAETAYQKPSSGIPTSDLASDVQTSLGKADTAIQEVKTINGNSIVGSGDINITSQTYVIDNTPTYNSNNLVTSGGVQKELALGAVWDVSEHNSLCGSTFESLSVILNSPNLDVLIPTSVRKGGMSIKFVQSSDNKYVTYFLTKGEWSTTESDWEKINLAEDVLGLSPIDLYINNGDKWASSTTNTYKAYVISVNSGDVISVTWKGTTSSTQGLRGLFAQYPEKLQTATNLLSSIVADAISEELTMPADGYFVFWEIFSKFDHRPFSLTLNNIRVIDMIKVVRTLIAEAKYAIVENAENVSTLEGNVGELSSSVTDMDNELDIINDKLGTVKTKGSDTPVSITWEEGGIKPAEIGSAINLSTSTAYKHAII